MALVESVKLDGERSVGPPLRRVVAEINRTPARSILRYRSGVYALCPYIFGAWDQPSKELPSLYENEGYFGAREMMAILATVYDPEHKNSSNPLCWPYRATLDDLRGLPPHVISVNELDALRDEGLAYYHKLVKAGVSCYSRTVNGTCHAADVLFPGVIPEVYAATLRDIKGFADSL